MKLHEVFVTLVAILGSPLQLLPNLRAAPAANVETHRQIVTAGAAGYRVEIPRAARNRWITIANAGTEIVTNPWVIANGQRDWFSADAILAGIVKPGMTGREKALAIWRFLVNHRYHDAPAHHGIEMHDPVRFLNVYGYGFCDDSAVNFMVLAERAGLQARVWGLSGHVVPEAYFEDGWRLLDPDGQIYYLEDDGHTIAGVKTLEQRPDLFRQYPSPFYKDPDKLIAIYTSAADNQVNEHYRKNSEAVHTMAFALRPGESLTRHHDNWGLYFAGERAPRAPKGTGVERFGNGRFVFAPVFADGLFAKGAEAASDLRAARDGDRWALTSDGRDATLVYRFASPYPYLDGTVTIKGRGRLAVAFSETGEAWQEVWRSDSDAPVDATVALSAQFRTRTGRPMYAYRLRVSFNGSLDSLTTSSDVQLAPASLPALERGPNTIRYRDASTGARRVQIEFAYENLPNQ